MFETTIESRFGARADRVRRRVRAVAGKATTKVTSTIIGTAAAAAALLLSSGASLAGGLALPSSDVGSLLLKDAMKATDAKRWDEADSLALRAPDPLVRALVDWRRFVRVGGGWGELSRFLTTYPDWPSASRIRARAEAVMPEDSSANSVLTFYGDRTPITARGALMKARALTSTGRAAEARDLIRNAWLKTPMGATSRDAFLARHGATIKDLHPQRADEMAWRGRAADSRALAPYLSQGAARVIDARVALSAREKGVDGKIEAVPGALRGEPGLAWARFDWRMSKGLRDTAAQLLHDSSVSADRLGRPDAWAGGRARLARSAYRAGQYREAYRLASRHHMTRGVSFADMEWFAGWVALEKLGDPNTAARHFQTLGENVSSPISRGRAAYWLARAKAAAGDSAGAANERRKALQFNETYYGQLAALELGGGASGSPAASGPRKASDAARNDDRMRAAILLAVAGRADLGRGFINALADDLSATELSALSLQMLDEDQPHYALRLAKAARKQGSAPDEALFPVIDLPQVNGGVEPALALAIMRQESEFNPQVVSHAGARGLMQLMPATAERTAPSAGLSYDKNRLLSDWRYNAALGRTYLAQMLARFGGSVPLAVAAYNAGPHRVDDWISRFGDPRRNQIDVINWVETIPFAETRNYVQRVLEASAVYRSRLSGGAVEKNLARDLFGGRG